MLWENVSMDLLAHVAGLPQTNLENNAISIKCNKMKYLFVEKATIKVLLTG